MAYPDIKSSYLFTILLLVMITATPYLNMIVGRRYRNYNSIYNENLSHHIVVYQRDLSSAEFLACYIPPILEI